MPRRINPDHVEPWYDPWKLKAEFMWAGYDGYAAKVAEILCVTETTAKTKINNSKLSHEDTIAIAKALQFTPEKYCEIFLKNVFGEPKTDD